MIKHGNEHRRHPVKRGASLRRHGLEHRERVKGLCRIDHGGAVRETAQIPHHHAEAVIERHGNAQTVPRLKADGLTDEKSVVQDVVMRQCRAFWLPGRA
ncbi:hypothetical protein SDC9_207336 [bioreactor metagenome]|uniref:Uncharacterized protein n=1 Tax=bioreactor metagenome TaxID=1076179 RepID=A0A645J7C2_9ZZZZ